MQTIEKEDGRVAKMRQLEKIFRCDPDLVREYQCILRPPAATVAV